MADHMNNCKTVSHQVVYTRQHNENSTSALDPFKSLEDFKAEGLDLDASGRFCWSFDDSRLVEAKLYEVRTVELPEWLSVSKWVADSVAWRYTWHAIGLPKTASQSLAELVHGRQAIGYGIVKLLGTKKFRSTFRASLKDQIVTWLESAEKAYSFPLSPRQTEYLLTEHDRREYNRRCTDLYNNRSKGS